MNILAQSSVPTREKVLVKCRRFLTNQELDILYQDSLPSSRQLQKENCKLEQLCTFEKCKVFLKKRLKTGIYVCLLVIASTPGFLDGVNIYSQFAIKTHGHFKFFCENFYNRLESHESLPKVFYIGSKHQQNNTSQKESDYFQKEIAWVSSSSMSAISNISSLLYSEKV